MAPGQSRHISRVFGIGTAEGLGPQHPWGRKQLSVQDTDGLNTTLPQLPPQKDSLQFQISSINPSSILRDGPGTEGGNPAREGGGNRGSSLPSSPSHPPPHPSVLHEGRFLGLCSEPNETILLLTTGWGKTFSNPHVA